MKHQGKSFLITGASRGIGAAIAKRLAEEGAKVAITYATQEHKAQEVLSSLAGEGHLALQMDLSQEESITQVISEINEKFGALDGLVNNAGCTSDQLLLRMRSVDFDKILNTNLRGSFLCTKLAVKPMLKARKGSLVHISSIVGHTGNPGQSNYSASKAGLEAFSRSVALELAARNIRSNCVAPGFIDSDMTSELSDEQKEKLSQSIPLGRIGEGQDVAAAVSFLLSDEANYITGQTLHVNGGMRMGS
jgi:3-oxoacyl-[acyl-carrier protein] reductase